MYNLFYLRPLPPKTMQVINMVNVNVIAVIRCCNNYSIDKYGCHWFRCTSYFAHANLTHKDIQLINIFVNVILGIRSCASYFTSALFLLEVLQEMNTVANVLSGIRFCNNNFAHANLPPKFIQLMNIFVNVISGIRSCTSFFTSAPSLLKTYM